MTKTSNKINAMQTVHISRSMLAAVRSEASSDLPAIKSKRNIPKSRDRIPKNWSEAPVGYYPDDNKILQLIDKVS